MHMSIIFIILYAYVCMQCVWECEHICMCTSTIVLCTVYWLLVVDKIRRVNNPKGILERLKLTNSHCIVSIQWNKPTFVYVCMLLTHMLITHIYAFSVVNGEQ